LKLTHLQAIKHGKCTLVSCGCCFSAESLSEEIRGGEYFHKLAVLDYNFPVSLLALSTIWDLDEWTAEKYMDGQSSWVEFMYSICIQCIQLKHFHLEFELLIGTT